MNYTFKCKGTFTFKSFRWVNKLPVSLTTIWKETTLKVIFFSLDNKNIKLNCQISYSKRSFPRRLLHNISLQPNYFLFILKHEIINLILTVFTIIPFKLYPIIIQCIYIF